jgi:hypothetical protein
VFLGGGVLGDYVRIPGSPFENSIGHPESLVFRLVFLCLGCILEGRVVTVNAPFRGYFRASFQPAHF